MKSEDLIRARRLCAIAAIFFLVAEARLIRRLDELEQRKQLEALAFSRRRYE